MLRQIFKTVVNRRPSSLFFIAAAVSLFSGNSLAQNTPQPTPEVTYGGYTITGATEFGWRWRSLDGNENKYRSDLNYKRGFRLFDSNLLFQKENGAWFDSLLIMNSGWGSDPSGYLRVNMEKTGYYKFNGSIRKIKYFNNLANFVAYNNISYHTQDWSQSLSDFDVTIMPQSKTLRLTFGASNSDTTGDGLWTSRGYRDDFPVTRSTNYKANDYRLGAEGTLWGFNWGLTQGFRYYKDLPNFFLEAPHPGFNTSGPNTTTYDKYSEYFPVKGNTSFTQFHFNRTFAEKFDFTGRLIYSNSNSTTAVNEQFLNARDQNNAFVDRDDINVNGQTKRPQTRSDVGFTWRATDRVRISNTFSFDQFAVNTGENYSQSSIIRNATNTTTTYTTANSYAYRRYNFRRFTNVLEADFQLNNAFAFHVGWRHTKRETGTVGTEGSVSTRVIVPTPSVLPTPSVSSLVIGEDEENSTNTLLVGGKIKPTKGWVIFWDVEHGAADNVFTRLENYDFTNFRVRSRWNYKTFTINVSAITKDNNNPSMTTDNLPFGTDMNTRIYTGDIDWNPNDRFRLSGGYSKRNITALTPVVICLVTTNPCPKTRGLSEWYVRDQYAYVEASAKLHKRFSLFAAYRMNKDDGQGDRISPAPPTSANIIGSYPMSYKTPEVRAVVRLTRNIDWNVGYQYYDYEDVQLPLQNYKAHLPYTSLRIYFGGSGVDRQ